MDIRAEDGALVVCREAAFGYDGHIAAANLSFTVHSGDYLCVVGENGSGKSTLLKGIARLIKPLRGSLRLAPALAREGIAYLSQQSAAKKDFPAGAREIVRSGAAGRMGIRPFYTRAEKERARANMERLGVADLEGRCFRELSGGQQRRVLIARALCASRALLALDEPAAGLDPLVTKDLYALLARLNRETGLTIIMVSHDARAALAYASHILHIQNSQRFFGPPDEYIRTALGKAFFTLEEEADKEEGARAYG